jgi:hypothetical protein
VTPDSAATGTRDAPSVSWLAVASHVSLCGRKGYAPPLIYHPTKGLEAAMAKGQMRSNREKKKPKQDKNKTKGADAPSPFAGMHSQVKLGTSYTSQYGKKH